MRSVAAEPERRPTLADIAIRAATLRQEQCARPVQIAPLGFIIPLPIKNLHAMILAVRDIDPAVLVAADIMRQVEFALADA